MGDSNHWFEKKIFFQWMEELIQVHPQGFIHPCGDSDLTIAVELSWSETFNKTTKHEGKKFAWRWQTQRVSPTRPCETLNDCCFFFHFDFNKRGLHNITGLSPAIVTDPVRLIQCNFSRNDLKLSVLFCRINIRRYLWRGHRFSSMTQTAHFAVKM